jgi:DNA-binding transcriptional regulator YhcF (GntR family)
MNEERQILDSAADVFVTDRIELELRREISQKAYQPGAMLPKQDTLVRRYQASRGSVRRALDRLKRDNLIQSIRGKGTFVLDSEQKLKGVLLISHGPHHSYQMIVAGVISNLLRSKGQTASLVQADDPASEWSSIVRDKPDASGAILIGSYPREAAIRLVKTATLPLVSLSDLDEPFRRPAVCDSVLPDHRAIGYRCVEYFARRGHTKIALLDWELTKSNGREFLTGYRQALDAYDLEYSPDWVIDMPTATVDDEGLGFSPPTLAQEARRAFSAWKAKGDLPTALIHGSGFECTINDIVTHYMDGHFGPDDLLGHPLKEHLGANFRGLGPATAICASMETMAGMALDLLEKGRRPNQPPMRYTVEDLHLYKRIDGAWREQPFEME